jgi:peptidyl-prolyl cis-trans isomerase C
MVARGACVNVLLETTAWPSDPPIAENTLNVREGDCSMLRTLASGLLSLIAIELLCVPGALAQTPAPAGATGGAAPLTPAAPGPATIPGWNDTVATITVGNQSEKIIKGDVISFLSNYPIPDDDRETIYRTAVEHVANTKLLMLYLARQKVPVTPERVNEEIEQLKTRLKAGGQDLPTLIMQNNISMEDVRKQIEDRVRWTEFLKFKATEATLRKYLADHRDFFSGTQVRVSHIMLKVEPNAAAAEKEKAKQRLANVKKEIEAGTLTFAAAANKYSEDPANEGGAGGDLDYITLSTGFVPEFTDVAFKMKKGMISDPVETPFGYHLIQVTDRKDGRVPDFEQAKVYILQEYGTELQKTVVAAERKTAKIDIKPMPKDLFPPQAPAAPTTTAPEPAKAKAAGAGAATPKS